MPKKNPRRTDKEWLDLIQESTKNLEFPMKMG